jgi:hypothetical protein
LEADSNVRLEKHLHRLKRESEIVSLDEIIQIERSNEQFANGDSPRIDIWQPDSKATLARHVAVIV